MERTLVSGGRAGAPAAPARDEILSMDCVPRTGDVVAGKYRVEGTIGMGGMGLVLAARHMSLGVPVAVKIMLPTADQVGGAVERFLREARTAASLRNEHVARVIDLGTLGPGLPFLVMEYLEGSTLDEVLAARGALPIEEAVDLVLQTCDAIAEAHALGILHRDLKPGNLFLVAGGSAPKIKVLDFGLSKRALDPAITGTDTTLGTPCYMSPEQVRSTRDVDLRTDIWAIGVILYELLTGRIPFEGTSVYEIFIAIVGDEPASPRAHRPEIPPALSDIVLRCLQKDVGRRVQTVAELARALVPFAPERSHVSVARITGEAPARAPLPSIGAVSIDTIGDTMEQRAPDEPAASAPPASSEEPTRPMDAVLAEELRRSIAVVSSDGHTGSTAPGRPALPRAPSPRSDGPLAREEQACESPRPAPPARPAPRRAGGAVERVRGRLLAGLAASAAAACIAAVTFVGPSAAPGASRAAAAAAGVVSSGRASAGRASPEALVPVSVRPAAASSAVREPAAPVAAAVIPARLAVSEWRAPDVGGTPPSRGLGATPRPAPPEVVGPTLPILPSR